jgi:hypothetical protein
MSRKPEDIDAVRMMRAARDRISAEIQRMAAEEEIAWLASRKLDDPFLEALRNKAVEPDGAPRRR